MLRTPFARIRTRATVSPARRRPRLKVETLEAREVPSVGGSGVGGRVWSDVDADGVQDTGEGGISGITVELRSGTSLVATTATGTDGAYGFSALAAGSYFVQVIKPTSPAAAAFTTQNVGSDDTDSDVDSTGKTDTFVLADATTMDRDAGLLNMGPPVTITKVRNTVEGDTGTKVGRFQVTRSGSGSLAVQLAFSGRATLGTDYTLSGSALSGTVVTIAPGSSFATFDVTATDDGVFERTEDVAAAIVAATDGSYSLGSPAKAAVLIADKLAPNDFPAEDSAFCGPVALGGAAGTGGSGAVEAGGSGGRYADGVLGLADTDLSAGGFGSALTLTRGFANGFGYDAAGYDGNNTVISALPYLKKDSTGVVFAVADGSTARFFVPLPKMLAA